MYCLLDITFNDGRCYSSINYLSDEYSALDWAISYAKSFDSIGLTYFNLEFISEDEYKIYKNFERVS